MKTQEEVLKQRIVEQYEVVSSQFGIAQGILFRDFVKHLEVSKILLNNLEKMDENAVVLDIAAGFAVPSRVLTAVGYKNVIGTDSFLTANKDTLLRSRRAINMVEVRNFELQPLPFKNEAIDIVCFLATIEHLHNSPKRILAEIFRVLKVGGVVIVDTPNILELRKRLMLLFGKSIAPDIRFVYQAEYNSGHHREYTLDEVQSVLRWSGFEIVDARVLDCLSPLSLVKRIPLRQREPGKGEIAQMTNFELGFHPFRIYDWLRLIPGVILKIMPQLRDTLLVVGRKAP